MTQITNEIINAAIEGFEGQKRRIDEQIAELRSMTNGSLTSNGVPKAPTARKGRTMSAEGRARIAEAQRKRWAASKGEGEDTTPAPMKRKRKLSAEGRANIVAALKKRWAAKPGGSVTAKTATTKNSAPKTGAKRGPVKRAARKRATTPAPASNAPSE